MPKDTILPATSSYSLQPELVSPETAPSHSNKIINNTDTIKNSITCVPSPMHTLSNAIPSTSNSTHDHDKELQLIDACERGDTEKVSILLESGISPNLRDQSDEPLLTLAYRLGHTKIAYELINHPQINISAYGKSKEKCLFLAYNQNDKDTLQLLFKRFKIMVDDFNIQKKEKKILNCWDPVRTVQFYTNVNTKNEERDETSDPLLLVAYRDKKYDIVRFLINLGADINEAGSIGGSFSGDSLLALAWRENDYAMAQFLLDNGANPNIQIDRQPLLVLAYQNKALFYTLLACKANSNVYDIHCQYTDKLFYQAIIWPLIMIAYHDKRFDIVDSLIKHGASIDVREKVADDDYPDSHYYPDQKSLLMMAYLKNNTGMMRDLLNRGANPAIAADKNNHSVLQVARQDNRQDIIDLLQSYNSDQNSRKYTTQRKTEIAPASRKRKERDESLNKTQNENPGKRQRRW